MPTATDPDPGVHPGVSPDVSPDVNPDVSPEVNMVSGIRGLLPFARPAAGRFACSALLAAASSLLGLVPLWAIYVAVDAVVTGDATRDRLFRAATVALAAVVGRFVLLGLSTFVSHVAAYEVLYRIRIGMAERLTRVPLGFVTQRRSGALRKVMGDDVERLEQFLAHGIPDMVAAFVTLVGAGIWLLWIDWRMGLASLLVVVPAVVCLGVAMGRGARSMGEYQETLADMNASVVELLRGMPVVKVFNRADDEIRGAEDSIRRHVSVVRRYSLDFLPLGTAFFVLVAANVVVVVPVGIWLWDRGSLSTSELLFFFIVGLGALGPVQSLLHLFANLSHLSTGGDLVREVMDAAELAVDGDGQPASAAVEFDNVTFGYGEAPVLHDLSFAAAPGTITALVGPSGSGKSTAAALLARFWLPDAGAVRVGGVDTRTMQEATLTSTVSVVLQDTFLFDDTIAANLRVARPEATDDELVAACRAARAAEFVAALPDGYDTVVGESGARLSGGERQRLTIARALLADTPVVVLDEATSFADPENEAAIQDALAALMADRTVILIAHRLSTVAGADNIVVLDRGRVVEEGRHDHLVGLGGLYARLWDDFRAAEETRLGDAVRGASQGVSR